MTKLTTKNWEGRFQDECGMCDMGYQSEYRQVETFIYSLLQSQKEEIIEELD